MKITYSDNLNSALSAPEIDPQYLVVANEYLAGRSINEISTTFNISPDRVSAICERPETKRYIDGVIATQGYMHRTRRLNIINKVIESKLEEALDSGVYSKKDLLEWIKLLNDMESAVKPKTPTTAVQVNQQTNYVSLMEDLLGDDK